MENPSEYRFVFLTGWGMAALVKRTSDQPHQPTRSALGRAEAPQKCPPFSLVEPYNRCTTQQPVICQF